MLTREKIKAIIEESPLSVLLSKEEMEQIIEYLYNRYGKSVPAVNCINYTEQKEEIYEPNHSV